MIRLLVQGHFSCTCSISELTCNYISHLKTESFSRIFIQDVEHDCHYPIQDQDKCIDNFTAWRDDPIDVIVRFIEPLDISLHSEKVPIIIYMADVDSCIANASDKEKCEFVAGCKSGQLIPLVPLFWSALPLLQMKLDAQVLHEGYYDNVYKPNALNGQETRDILEIDQCSTVILNIQQDFDENEIKCIMNAFKRITLLRSDVFLVLSVQPKYKKCIDKLFIKLVRDGVIDKGYWKALNKKGQVIVISDNLSSIEQSNLINSSSIYVSPFTRGSFNTPVLNAMACGVPVITTESGCTDDLFIKSSMKIRSAISKTGVTHRLIPMSLHLTDLIIKCIDSHCIMKQKAMGNVHTVKQKFTWNKVADDLCDFIWGVVQHVQHPSHPFGNDARSQINHRLL